MAITTKFLEELGIEKEVADKIFAERGKELDAEKSKRAEVEQKLTEAQNSLDDLKNEYETLKNTNASAEDYKQKFEELQQKVEADKAAADEKRQAEEREANITARFEKVVGDKKFKHQAIADFYRQKFGEAVASADFAGQSDADVFGKITENDSPFEGVTVVKLAGAENKPAATQIDEDKARAVMGLPRKE